MGYFVRIGDGTSLHTSAQMLQKWPKNLHNCEDFMVFCLILGLAPRLCASQRNVTLQMSQIPRNVIMCIFVRIGDGTSLHTSTQIGKNGQSG